MQDTELIYHGIRLWTQRDLYNLIHEKEIDVSSDVMQTFVIDLRHDVMYAL